MPRTTPERERRIWNDDLVRALEERANIANEQNNISKYSFWTRAAEKIQSVSRDIYTFQNGRIIGLPNEDSQGGFGKLARNECEMIIRGQKPIIPPSTTMARRRAGATPTNNESQTPNTPTPIQGAAYLNRMQYRGGGYALLLAFHLHPNPRGRNFHYKNELIKNAQPHCDEAMAPNYFRGRTTNAGWASMKSLVNYRLVDKSDRKAERVRNAYAGGAGGFASVRDEYRLTRDGETFIQAMLQKWPLQGTAAGGGAARGGGGGGGGLTPVGESSQSQERRQRPQQDYAIAASSSSASMMSAHGVVRSLHTDMADTPYNSSSLAQPPKEPNKLSLKDENQLVGWLNAAKVGDTIPFRVSVARRKFLHDYVDFIESSHPGQFKFQHGSMGEGRERCLVIRLCKKSKGAGLVYPAISASKPKEDEGVGHSTPISSKIQSKSQSHDESKMGASILQSPFPMDAASVSSPGYGGVGICARSRLGGTPNYSHMNPREAALLAAENRVAMLKTPDTATTTTQSDDLDLQRALQASREALQRESKASKKVEEGDVQLQQAIRASGTVPTATATTQSDDLDLQRALKASKEVEEEDVELQEAIRASTEVPLDTTIASSQSDDLDLQRALQASKEVEEGDVELQQAIRASAAVASAEEAKCRVLQENIGGQEEEDEELQRAIRESLSEQQKSTPISTPTTQKRHREEDGFLSEEPCRKRQAIHNDIEGRILIDSRERVTNKDPRQLYTGIRKHIDQIKSLHDGPCVFRGILVERSQLSAGDFTWSLSNGSIANCLVERKQMNDLVSRSGKFSGIAHVKQLKRMQGIVGAMDLSARLYLLLEGDIGQANRAIVTEGEDGEEQIVDSRESVYHLICELFVNSKGSMVQIIHTKDHEHTGRYLSLMTGIILKSNQPLSPTVQLQEFNRKFRPQKVEKKINSFTLELASIFKDVGGDETYSRTIASIVTECYREWSCLVKEFDCCTSEAAKECVLLPLFQTEKELSFKQCIEWSRYSFYASEIYRGRNVNCLQKPLSTSLGLQLDSPRKAQLMGSLCRKLPPEALEDNTVTVILSEDMDRLTLLSEWVQIRASLDILRSNTYRLLICQGKKIVDYVKTAFDESMSPYQVAETAFNLLKNDLLDDQQVLPTWSTLTSKTHDLLAIDGLIRECHKVTRGGMIPMKLCSSLRVCCELVVGMLQHFTNLNVINLSDTHATEYLLRSMVAIVRDESTLYESDETQIMERETTQTNDTTSCCDDNEEIVEIADPAPVRSESPIEIDQSQSSQISIIEIL